MKNLAQEILRFAAANDMVGMLGLIQREAQDGDQAILAVYELLIGGQIREAYALAKVVLANGTAHPIAALALSVGGLMAGRNDDFDLGNTLLTRIIDATPADKQAAIYSEIISRAVPNLVNHAFISDNDDMLMKLLDVLKAGVPLFRTIFDLQAPPVLLDLKEMKAKGRSRATLVPMDGLPSGTPRTGHKAVVAVREYFLGAVIDPKKSRLCEIGPRVAASFDAYGWPSQFYGMRFLNVEEDYRGIGEMCRQTGADILVLDDNLTQNETAKSARAGLIAQLKQENPGLKVVSMYFDPWMIAAEDLIQASAVVDVVWTPSPSSPVWQHPAMKAKVCMAPYTLGVDFVEANEPLEPKLTFAGSVMGNNWHRALWLGALKHEGLPVIPQISLHKPDGLSPLDSYTVYLQRLADATCSLNFSMRNDFQRILTSRTNETILSGALLVEEWGPDIDHYFIAGDHYLEFSTFSELRAAARFVENNIEEAESIRKAGTAFARERYNDLKIVANLEKYLYHPETLSEAPIVSATTPATPAAPPVTTPSPPGKSFSTMIGADVRVKVVDIGANPINGPAPYEGLLRSGCAEVVGFEPNLEALAELQKIKGPNEIYLPHAIGDGKRHTLNFCQAPGMTSLLVPNQKVLELFHAFPEWGRVVSAEAIDTVRLDDIPETSNVDFLKMDIQGAELMVLQHSEDRLRDTLVVQTEVEFLQMYIDQPLFGDIDVFLRERGFVFHRFFPTVSRVIKPLVVDNNIYAGLSQLFWADAVFVRDFTKLELFSDRQLISAAAILHDCFQSIDLCLYLLNEHDRRQGSRLGANYLTSVRNP